MISGVEITDLTKKHAQELLETANVMNSTLKNIIKNL